MEQAADSISGVAVSASVLDPVIEDLGLDESASVIADATAQQLARTPANLSPAAPRGAAREVTGLQQAVVPDGPSSPDPLRNLLVSVGIALLVGLT